MNIKSKISLLICASLLGSSCARRYHAISPETLNYSATANVDNVELGYRYGVLRDRGNNRLAKKEDKRHIKLLAVKITNQTTENMVIGGNYNFYIGSSNVSLLPPEVLESSIKQNTLTYLPYLLLTALTLKVTKNDGFGTESSSSFPIGLIIGPGITAGNMIVASNANKKLLDELRRYNIINQTIRPGETKYGLIGIDATSYDPIVLKKK